MAQANLIQTSISGRTLNALASQGDGLILPKLSSADRTALVLTTADAGLTVYDTTATAIYTWSGTAWLGATVAYSEGTWVAGFTPGGGGTITLDPANKTGRWARVGNTRHGHAPRERVGDQRSAGFSDRHRIAVPAGRRFRGSGAGHRQRTQQSRPDTDHRKHHWKHHEDLPLRFRHVAGSWVCTFWLDRTGTSRQRTSHESSTIPFAISASVSVVPLADSSVANIVPDPTIANALGGSSDRWRHVTVIIKNLLDIYHNHFK
jgi:hypothetical protein